MPLIRVKRIMVS
jgi:hypothetical protein